MTPTPITGPTGRQFVIQSPDATVSATITQVGAALRALVVDGVDLVPTYPADSPSPAASGVVLVPWPNRVGGGRWTQRGQTRQLAITEPQLGNASHGLLRFAAYTPDEESAADRVTLSAAVYPQTGYPFHLETSVTYAVAGSGIEVTHSVSNAGADEAPVALGTHPYLLLGGASTSELTLTSSGETQFVLDAQKLPIAEIAVDADSDLRGGRRLGDVDLDTAYGSLHRDPDGRVRHVLRAPDGRTLTLWQGEGFDFVQVFTTDRYPGQELAVAIEPMTAPADAFNSGRGLRWLAPGETWTLQWGIEYTA